MVLFHSMGPLKKGCRGSETLFWTSVKLLMPDSRDHETQQRDVLLELADTCAVCLLAATLTDCQIMKERFTS